MLDRAHKLLVAASPQLADTEERHLAEVLASLILAATAVNAFVIVTAALLYVDLARTNALATTLGAMPVYLASYALARTRHFRWAGAMVMTTILAGTTASALALPPATAMWPLLFASIAVFISAFLFSMRVTLAVAGLVLFGVIPLMVALGKMTALDASALFFLELLTTVLVAVLAVAKQRHLRLIKAQQEQLAFESKMASLGVMAGGIAHEINTPLATILLRAQTLQRLLAATPAAPAKAAEAVAVIEHTVQRISGIVAGLRAFSRDGGDDEMTAVPLAELVEGVLVFCRERFEADGIALTVEPVPAASARCRATQIGQILLNLLNNALDAARAAPERWVTVRAEAGARTVRILVTDSGAGVDARIRAQIFDPFFTTKALGKGTGIGLSISSGLAAANGGKLGLDEQAEHTTFVLTLARA
jgi:signal transduction histidine kinase